MKVKASKFLKDLLSAIVAAVKARSTAVRAKTSAARTRLVIFGILRNKKLLASAINRKIHAVMAGAGAGGGGGHGDYGDYGVGEAVTSSHRGHGESCGAGGDDVDGGLHLLGGAAAGAGGAGGRRKAAVLQSLPSFVVEQETRAVVLLSTLPSFAMDRDGGGEVGEEMQDEEEEMGGRGKQQQQQQPAAAGLARGGAELLRLEDEIDHVADAFIRRFHEQMKLQKLESFKRLCEMLERN